MQKIFPTVKIKPITLASKTQVDSSPISSKTYLLVVPTGAPSNSEQSKRLAVGNLSSSEKNQNQFFHLLEDDIQPKTLKRKVPATISPLTGTRLAHFSRKDQQTALVRSYPNSGIPLSPPSSGESSSSSLSSITQRHPSVTCVPSNTPHLLGISDEENFPFNKEETLSNSISVNQLQETSLNLTTTGNIAEDHQSQSDKQDLSTWVKMDGMESDLVKDFDNNLSGLGLELGANAYNMSEVLNLPIFRQEGLLSNATNQGLPPLQYMLCAPTSPATKVYEETLTYLNQGQSYEIKLKKLREIQNLGNLKLVKSQLRVVFHDRRLQYTEYQQFQSWKFNRPGDRLLNIDIPMSVGVLQPRENPDHLNIVEFVWEIEKEASVWIQVHCISTEFTPKKHGGEKGVPFRIQIDTYALESNGELGHYIHSASCQIKVFKPKGADRKQKTDKDKMEKRSTDDKLKYQPSYDSTLLSECMPTLNPIDPTDVDLTRPSSHTHILEQITEMVTPQTNYSVVSHSSSKAIMHNDRRTKSYSPSLDSIAMPPPCIPAPISQTINTAQESSTNHYKNKNKSNIITSSTTPLQLQEWLQRFRFGPFIKHFTNFSGSDILALSRDDVTQICGCSDGIRLHNALRAKTMHPRLTIYLTPAVNKNDDSMPIYKAFYLERATIEELTKAASACIFQDNDTSLCSRISRILYQPPRSNIHVLVTDEVVAVMKDESSFTVSFIKTENPDSFQVLLRP